ncbi:MAG: methionyl-tRNA formyltransferase [Chitinophagaceae bacterium]
MIDYKRLRIVFLGTPDFAVASLDALAKAGCSIVGVITAPDKPAGRGMQLQQSAVKKYAIENNLKVLQPDKLKNEAFISELRLLKADVQVVVAFRMLPEIVWNMPPMGTINVHGSLLPHYRGAAPINWAIINGEKQTGVTTFKLKHEIDTGNILMQEIIPIGDDENAGELHDKMKDVGARLLVKTIEAIAENKVDEIEQYQKSNIEHQSLLHAPKIFTDTCKIDWAKSINEVYNLVRGLSPYPAAYTTLNDKKIKIFSCEKEITSPKESIGSYITNNKTFLKFVCTDGYISIVELQMEGKKRIKIEEFLKGFRN